MIYKEYFTQGQLLRALGRETADSTEDDVDDIRRILEILSPRLVTPVIILLVLSLAGLVKGWCVE
jgi:hypothetical protein